MSIKYSVIRTAFRKQNYLESLTNSGRKKESTFLPLFTQTQSRDHFSFGADGMPALWKDNQNYI